MAPKMRGFAILVCAWLLIGVATLAHAQPLYTIRDLGVLPGTTSCSAWAISDTGTIVGQCMGAQERAFTWENGVMTALGKLPKGNYSEAHAVDGRGAVVGEADTGDFRPHPTLYRNGAVIDIDASGGNARGIYITDGGVIIGNYSKGFGNASSWSAVIWTERPTQPGRFERIGLQPYPGGESKARYGYATGANETVQVVGWVQNSLFGQMGAFWNNDGNHTLSLLQPLPGDWTSLAWGVNGRGQAVGESRPPSHTQAVLWLEDPAHTPVALGMLDGDSDSTATAINMRGQIIGASMSANGTRRPVLWQDGHIFDLGGLLDSSGAAWVIQDVTGINNLAQIAGYGLYLGQPRAFVMTPASQ